MELPEKEVKVKISYCQQCNGYVRLAIEHKMNTKSKNEFAKEVFKYDLSVKTISLIEYRNNIQEYCKCDS